MRDLGPAQKRIAALYAIEDRLKGQPAEARKAQRAQARPLVEAMKL